MPMYSARENTKCAKPTHGIPSWILGFYIADMWIFQ